MPKQAGPDCRWTKLTSPTEVVQYLYAGDVGTNPGRGPSRENNMKIIIEKHPEGYVGYPAGLQGVVVGQGNTFEEALRDVQSAIRFHIETFGREALESESPALDAFVAEATV
jgi:predicted RNase H-like HicB family nuclease